MTELKPCPFCGGAVEAHMHRYGGRMYTIRGEHELWCPLLGKWRNYRTEAEAINAWSTRHEVGMTYEDASIMLDELGASERTCRSVFDGNMDGTSVCSRCGGEMPQDPNRRWRLNYCPNCGAKVVEA